MERDVRGCAFIQELFQHPSRGATHLIVLFDDDDSLGEDAKVFQYGVAKHSALFLLFSNDVICAEDDLVTGAVHPRTLSLSRSRRRTFLRSLPPTRTDEPAGIADNDVAVGHSRFTRGGGDGEATQDEPCSVW